MSKINELKNKRGKYADTMQNMVKDIEGDFTAEQDATFTTASEGFDAANKAVKRLELVENAQTISNKIDKGNRPNVTSDTNKDLPINATPEYLENFQNFLNSKGSVTNSLSVGTDAKGGFVVPEEWETSLIKDLDDETVMRQVSTVVKLKHDRNYPGIVDNGSAEYLLEDGVYGESDLTLDNRILHAYKQGRIIKVSDEIEQDAAVNIPKEIRMAFTMTFGTGQEAAFTIGTGSNKPTGIVPSASAGNTSLAVGGLAYEDILNLKYSLKKQYRIKGGFMCNSNTILAIRKLKDSNGQFLWQPSLQAGEPGLLDGSPVHCNEQMVDIATGSVPMLYGDYRHYKIADRLGIQLLILKELYAGSGQLGFRFTARNDGKLMLSVAVKKLTVQ